MTWIKVQKLRTNASGTVSKIISVGGTNACRIEPQEGGQVAVAPKKQTRGLRVTTQLLELLWTAIAKRLMQSLAIVEHLNILRDGVAGFGLMLEAPMPD